LPFSAAVDAALAAAQLCAPAPCSVDEVVAGEPCVIPDEQALVVQCVVTPNPGGSRFELYTRESRDDAPWHLHLTARLSSCAVAPEEGPGLDEVRAQCTVEVSLAGYHDALRRSSRAIGPAFQGLTRLLRGEGEALGEARLPERAAAVPGCAIHPILFEACLQ